MGIFDALVIKFTASEPLGQESVYIQRTDGPLESGQFIGSNWVFSAQPQQILYTSEWGIDAESGYPYYDTDGASPGEQAHIWLDPGNFQAWLELDTG